MATDIRFDSWILQCVPRRLEPYCRLMRLDRPAPLVLFLLPAFWGLFAVSSGWPPLSISLLFAAGTVLMRSAGCVANDLIDRHIDPHVARTKQRPLASGELTPRQGLYCLGVILALALPLLLALNLITILLGGVLVALVILYPFMKRVTYWPQIFLGITVNWGILMGSTALTGGLTTGSLFLFMTGSLWTLFYDTLYAHQDKKEDALLGLKSTALRLQNRTKPFLWGTGGLMFGGLMSFALTTQPPLGGGALVTFALFSIGACLGLLLLLQRTDLEKPSACLKAFRQSQIFGWLVLLALIGRACF